MAPNASRAQQRPHAVAAALSLSTERDELPDTSSSRKHPHAQRRTEILNAHPDVTRLFGTDRASAAYALALVALQLALAAALAGTSVGARWYVWAPAAYAVGALVDHALWVLIHDAAHNLVFKKVAWNRVLLCVANLPHVFPSAMIFRYYHILHHIELNRVAKDPDVPARWEARMVGNNPVMKALWLAFFFLFQAARMMFYTYRVPKGAELFWIAVNWAACMACNAAVTYFFGWRALAYLTLASMSAIGLHPLGARWIQEHYPTQPFQSTYSYYGPLNRLAFNIGFHNEHHDFPSVPWSKLPALKRMAPDYYDTLFAYRSYSELLRDFIVERRWSLMVRWEEEMKHQ